MPQFGECLPPADTELGHPRPPQMCPGPQNSTFQHDCSVSFLLSTPYICKGLRYSADIVLLLLHGDEGCITGTVCAHYIHTVD